MRKIILLLSLILIVIIYSASLVMACDPMNGEPEGEASPALAYDAANNRFLMVYTKCAGEGRPEIYGKLIKHDGTAYGNEFVISGTANAHNVPMASYDSVNGKFLVVWYDDRNDPDNTHDIYGQIVGADGTASSGNFVIADDENDQYAPVAAYDNVNQRFLVVWYDDRSDPWSTYDIYGQFVGPAGTLSGDNFPISDDPGNQTDPHIVYDGSNQRFLVVWDDYRGATIDIYGQIVNAAGTMSGGNFIISDADSNQWVPAAAYDNVNGRFLVSWYDFRNPCADPFAPCSNSDIYGQFVSSDGALLNTASSDNFVVSNGTSEYMLQSVSAAYNSADQRFFTAWSGDEAGGIFGQTIDANGDLIGGNLTIADDPDGTQYSPSVVYNPVCNNFLVALNTDYFITSSISLETVGTCQASPPTAPALVSPADGATGLDTTVVFTWDPSTDPDGDAVTYKLSYCTDQNFAGCAPVNVASLNKRQTLYAGTGKFSGLFLMGMIFLGGLKTRRNIIMLLVACLTVTLIFASCNGGSDSSHSSSNSSSDDAGASSGNLTHTLSSLAPNTTYFWKVTADDGKGGTTDSVTRSFTTR
ncbi:MAG: hypothetical protein HZC49_12530 [Nitrospirae bacterium]|nr:hypothetical protein [Nitrospirota bacterium]